MKHKETHKTVEVIEKEGIFLGVFLSFFFCGKFSLYTSHTHYSDTSSDSPSASDCPINSNRKFASHRLVPTSTLLSGRHPQVATCPLTCHPRNSWCCHCSGPGLLKKIKKSSLIASGCGSATQA